MGGGNHIPCGQLVVFWAAGGGLGHLTRALAIARWLKSPYRIYASAYVELGRLKAQGHVYRICKGCVEDIARLEPRVIVSDVVPYGGKRALAAIDTRHVLLDRGCKVRPPVFGCDRVIDLNERRVLIRQPEEWSVEGAREILGDDEPVLAFHAGILHRQEAEIVIRKATEIAHGMGKRLVVMTPWAYYPICELLPAASAAVCAAGYNAHSETQAWGGRVHYIPLDRRCDDQVARSKTRPVHFDGALAIAKVLDECSG